MTDTVTSGIAPTPRPWRVNYHDAGRYIADLSADLGKNGGGIMQIRTIATVLKYCGDAEAAANAALIVKCVNLHDELVAALLEAREIIDDLLDSEIDNNTTEPGEQHTREYKRRHVVIDSSGGRDIPIFEAIISKIDALVIKAEAS